MNLPHFALACRWCDAVISAPCELGGIQTLAERFKLAGWRWIDGWATCPDCSVKHRAKQEAA
jgi:hypothetical protein